MAKTVVRSIDWVSVIIYIALVAIGWINIYSASVPIEELGHFEFNSFYGKQLIFIGLSVLLIIFILAMDAKFFERFSSIIYIIILVSLVGLFIFGKNVNGARAWYSIGGSTLQPSEFAKCATALAVAKFLSDIQTNIQLLKDQLQALIIIAIPAILILLQPDPGSTMVYTAFVFVLYREGLPGIYIAIGLAFIAIFVSTLKFGILITLAVVSTLLLAYYLLFRKKKKRLTFPLILILISSIVISLSSNYIYNNVFKQHHRDRFVLWLRLENDPIKIQELKRTIGYNINQSENAIGSGGLLGKGFLEGTRTRGDYVPEQHTDYIFTTVGEEWGFAGTMVVVILFTLLLVRLIIIAERQKSKFSRIYGYSVAAILFIHYLVNIGMVIGLLPTVGIPLPFFSYGGSGLWGFTILLFLFLKLDSNRVNEWMER